MITNINDIKNNICGIYVLCYDNNKYYVGQSIDIRSRALEHNSKNRQLCDIALKKHNAILKILEITDNINELDILEQYWIIKYKSNNKNYGYNLTAGGDVSGKRGITHANALFDEKTLQEVIDLLLYHHELSLKDIAKKYNVEQDTILRISKGKSYFNPKLKYPLRNNIHSFMKKNDVLDYFNSVEELLALKEDLYFRWDLSIENDLKNKYNIPLNILREINLGQKFANIGEYNYPIRKKNIRNIYNFTQQDIINILNLLHNTNLSMSDIGAQYHIHRNTVSKINSGLNYPIKNYCYPARK